jgi:antitoxin ParD1/3/4
MNFSLTPEFEEYILKKVKTGLYHSASEVIREGLRLLREQDELRAIRLKQLRTDVEAGLDDAHNGRVSMFDPKETIKKAKARRSKKKA